MKSLLLISILLGWIAIPLLASRDPLPRRGMRRMLLLLFLFNAAYVLYLTQAHVRLFVPHR